MHKAITTILWDIKILKVTKNVAKNIDDDVNIPNILLFALDISDFTDGYCNSINLLVSMLFIMSLYSNINSL